MSPHGGGEKGFYFVPEVGEEVQVGFEQDNAERPFVLGSLYHGKAKPSSWKTDANNIKAIRTRGGHTIQLNDADGEETITISDKSGNTILLDVKNSSISISSPAHLSLSANTISIQAKHGLTITSEEETIAIQAKQDIGLHSKEAKLQISGKQSVDLRSTEDEVKIKAKKAVNIVGNEKVEVLSGEDLIMHGKALGQLTGGKVYVNKEK